MEKFRLSEEELGMLLNIASVATPRPWFVRQLDDQCAASLVAISTRPDTGKNERWPEFDPGEIVAATIVQNPRYASIADEKWDENAEYIVSAAEALPDLIREVLELRARLAAIEGNNGN